MHVQLGLGTRLELRSVVNIYYGLLLSSVHV